jgi:hypothetical protein
MGSGGVAGMAKMTHTQGVEPMKKLNLSAIAALLVLSLALCACAADRYAYRDGHGRGDGIFAD